MNNGTSTWASAIVAVAVLLVIGAIAVAAIMHYPTVADAKQVLDWMGPLVAVVTGAFVGYFFTRGQVSAATQTAQAATQQSEQSQQLAQQAQGQADQAQKRADVLSKAVTEIAGKLPTSDWDDLKNTNVALQEALAP